jgi:cytosine/uracil/thiamine/allantoin permease
MRSSKDFPILSTKGKYGYLEVARRYLVIACMAFVGGGFWGCAVLIGLKQVFHIPEVHTLLYLSSPVGFAIAIYLWIRLPAMLGYDE